MGLDFLEGCGKIKNDSGDLMSAEKKIAVFDGCRAAVGKTALDFILWFSGDLDANEEKT